MRSAAETSAPPAKISMLSRSWSNQPKTFSLDYDAQKQHPSTSEASRWLTDLLYINRMQANVSMAGTRHRICSATTMPRTRRAQTGTSLHPTKSWVKQLKHRSMKIQLIPLASQVTKPQAQHKSIPKLFSAADLACGIIARIADRCAAYNF